MRRTLFLSGSGRLFSFLSILSGLAAFTACSSDSSDDAGDSFQLSGGLPAGESGSESGGATAGQEGGGGSADEGGTNPADSMSGGMNSSSGEEPSSDSEMEDGMQSGPVEDEGGADENEPSEGGDSEGPTMSGSEGEGMEAGDESVEAACGDSVVDPGEDCDDGNLDNVDGCTEDCIFGPRGIEFGDREQLGPHNAEGGINSTDECANGQVLTGIEGKTRNVAGAIFVGTVRGTCRSLELTESDGNYSLSFGDAVQMPERGNTEDGSASPFGLQCPEGSVVVGYEGNGSSALAQIKIRCAAIALEVIGEGDSYQLSVGASSEVGSAGQPNMAGIPRTECSAGRIATELVTRWDPRYVNAFGLGCEAPSVVMGPE